MKPYFLLTLIILLTTLFKIPAESASSIDVVTDSSLIHYLSINKAQLILNSTKTQQLPISPINSATFIRLLQENEASIALNYAKIASLENFLVNQKKREFDFSQDLKRLEKIVPNKTQTNLSTTAFINNNFHGSIAMINAHKAVNKKIIALITENLDLSKRYQDILIKNKQLLNLMQYKEKMHRQLKIVSTKSKNYKILLNKFYTKSIGIQQELSRNKEFRNQYTIEARLLLNSQKINLIQQKIAELDLEQRLIKANYLLLKNSDLKTLLQVTSTYKTARIQLTEREQRLKKMRVLLTKVQSHLNDKSLAPEFTVVLNAINSIIEKIGIQQQTLQEDLENNQQALNEQFSVRQRLSTYKTETWSSIFVAVISQLAEVPNKLYTYLHSLLIKVQANYLWQDNFSNIILWISLVSVAGLSLNLHKFFTISTASRSYLSGHIYNGIKTLIKHNRFYLAFTTCLLTIFYQSQLPFTNYQLLLNLCLILLISRSFIKISGLLLLERISDASGKDVHLYYRIKWILTAAAGITVCITLSHELPLSLLLQDIANRLLMLFLILVAKVVWKNKKLINDLLEPFLNTKKKYLQNALRLLLILLPITLFVTAVIGLIGYINLAWTMSLYQAKILGTIFGYILARGLLLDALELISEWMISSLANGWLWIEILLKPFYKIMHFILVFASAFILFQLLSWHSDSTVMQLILKWGKMPIVNLSGIHITIISFLKFLILVSLFTWAAKWTRELCYRWLFAKKEDIGVRNSLSVFTQYGVILLGGFITLHVLGLDFSGMSMVIGGLAVGMGFGLRDFASNIVGGLMLLIERPVRVGDLITLGNHEGRVAHIGIRSMRVSSWDNMEVLIPNAETLNNSFTNWTHQDGIVRTVIPIKVSRADCPEMIQELIFEVLTQIPEIVATPASQVLLKQIDEALIEFEVRYFINVQLYTRFEIRSKVLFAITAKFKSFGVKAPIPPLSIEVTSERINRKKYSTV